MGELTNNVKRLRDVLNQIAMLNQRVKDLEKERGVIEESIKTEMLESNMTLARTPYGSISITTSLVPSPKNWDELEQYIYENHALYLLQRRISSPAYRELLESGVTVPGVEVFENVKVSLRNRNT